MSKTLLFGSAALILGSILLGGCQPSEEKSADSGSSKTDAGAAKTGGAKLAGTLTIDGSSTVFPITSAAAEEFKKANPGVTVNVSQAGTGAGMKKFLAKEISICDASRPIEAKEIADAKTAGIEFVEVPIAYDGLSVVVNKGNTWVKTITADQLKKIWEPESKVKNWSDVDPKWPAKPIKLFGPTTAHGSFEYWTEAIVKQKKKSRPDYQQCTDYNQLVAGVSGDPNALGYVGFAYFKTNEDKIAALGVDAGKGPISPSEQTIADGTYAPLSRPLEIYIEKSALAKPEVKAFITYLLTDGKKVISDSGYIPLPDDLYKAALDRVNNATTGSVLTNYKPGDSVAKLYGVK